MVTTPRPSDPLLWIARGLAGISRRYHRATLDGVEHIPAGAALLIGNHGLFGLDSPAFFELLHAHTGRQPIGLADRNVFGLPVVRPLLARIGGVPGTRDNARELLEQGHLVVCYPGGSREVFKEPDRSYALRWEATCGFAHVAIATGVPVLPFAGLGVDDTYVNFGAPPLEKRLLGRYAVPLALGLGPLPLPVKFRFRLGAPMTPPSQACEADAFKDAVHAAVENLLAAAPSAAPSEDQP